MDFSFSCLQDMPNTKLHEVKIMSVRNNGIASKGGLRFGDVLVMVNNIRTDALTQSQFMRILGDARVIMIDYERDGEGGSSSRVEAVSRQLGTSGQTVVRQDPVLVDLSADSALPTSSPQLPDSEDSNDSSQYAAHLMGANPLLRGLMVRALTAPVMNPVQGGVIDLVSDDEEELQAAPSSSASCSSSSSSSSSSNNGSSSGVDIIETQKRPKKRKKEHQELSDFAKKVKVKQEFEPKSFGQADIEGEVSSPCFLLSFAALSCFMSCFIVSYPSPCLDLLHSRWRKRATQVQVVKRKQYS
jgi:hypothetical protein